MAISLGEQETKNGTKSKKSWPYFEEMNRILSDIDLLATKWLESKGENSFHSFFFFFLKTFQEDTCSDQTPENLSATQ